MRTKQHFATEPFLSENIALLNVWGSLLQRWGPRGRSRPRGHILKSLALASKPPSPRKCPVLGRRQHYFLIGKKGK